jgi:hypothetical protein
MFSVLTTCDVKQVAMEKDDDLSVFDRLLQTGHSYTSVLSDVIRGPRRDLVSGARQLRR